MLINCFYSGGMPSDALYRELWHACAGPLVTVPRQGERVYYFPQGHMEQVFTGLINLVFCGALRVHMHLGFLFLKLFMISFIA